MKKKQKEEKVVLEETAPEEVDKKKLEKQERARKSVFLELIRFGIVGLIVTLVDLAIQIGLLWAFSGNLSKIEGWGYITAVAIAVTVGFVISVILNFILSRVWVFRNVDKRIDTKAPKTFWLFFVLSLGGLILSIGIEELGVWLCKSLWSLELNYIFEAGSNWRSQGWAFWSFLIIFCVKTLIVCTYNYLTRKLIIFRKPKDDGKDDKAEVVVVEEAKADEKKAGEGEGEYLTSGQLRAVVHEEFLNFYGKGQLLINREEAKAILREEFDKYYQKNPPKAEEEKAE